MMLFLLDKTLDVSVTMACRVLIGKIRKNVKRLWMTKYFINKCKSVKHREKIAKSLM